MKKNHRTSAAAIGAALAVIPLAASPAAAQDTTQADSTGTPLDDNLEKGDLLSADVADNTNFAETDRFIVTFEDGVEIDEKEAVADEVAEAADSTNSADVIKDSIATDSAKAVVQVDGLLSEGDQQEVMDKLLEDPRVASVEPDYMIKAESSVNTGAKKADSNQQDWLDQLGAPAAWNAATGKGVNIAVIDSGSTNHSDLNSQYVKGYDFLSSAHLDRDGQTGRDADASDPGTWGSKESNWHGTHVMGIAAAAMNGSGTTGVAPDAKIQPVRTVGVNGVTYVSDLADSITWSAGGQVAGVPVNETPANVINASINWTAATCPSAIQTAINFATSKNIPVVVSAGNNGANAATVAPANCANAIVVGATNASESNLAYYSNYGADVDVVVRGDNIYSTVNQGKTTPTAEGWGNMSGTSMAAPQVSGIVALLKQQKPNITVEEVRSILRNTGDTMNTTNKGSYKVANAEAAVAALGGNTKEVSQPANNTVGSATHLKQTFTDVAAGDQFSSEINWLVSKGITKGYADGTYRPAGQVERAAMAAFFYRMAGSPNYTAPSVSPFKDVPTTHAFYKEISWMAAQGITTGYADGTFRPDATVNRDAMAAFFYRMAGSPNFNPASVASFNDISKGDQFYKEVSWMKTSGISTGWGDGTYRPSNSINRDAMAAFLYRFDNNFN